MNLTERNWVWRCTDESIAAGKISVLALAELPCSMAFFAWVSYISPWLWMTWIGMLAAPLLLLRSETSIAEGLRRLGAYLDPEAPHRVAARMKTRWGNITMNFASIVFLGLIGYFWSWLDSSFGLSVWAILIVLITAFVVAIMLFLGASFYGDPDQGTLSAPISEVVFLPFYVVGMFLRTLSIRVVATMSHPLQGLAQLPLNWRETVAVIDLCHLPELLPRAGTINQKLTMAGLLVAPSSRLSIAIGYKPVLALLMYLPAVLYRWNLKASAWLWWPLASMITPPYRGQTETERYEVVGQTSKGYGAKIRNTLAYLIAAWLATAFLPPEWISKFNFVSELERASQLAANFPVPSLTSIRYWLLALAAGRLSGCTSRP